MKRLVNLLNFCKVNIPIIDEALVEKKPKSDEVDSPGLQGQKGTKGNSNALVFQSLRERVT